MHWHSTAIRTSSFIFELIAAYDLGYMATTAEELVEFLQEVSAKDLMKHTSNSKFIPRADEPKTIYIEWNPIVESKKMFRVLSNEYKY